ncbi:hypothetical protein ACQP2F_15470 [Actinoplanes sp. CA-030573]|uniref:hypothetical protein n=1 Tax=Actinoplanes sp. CA-030573 TaxID=3239898 RepID=UPI003D946047
MNGHAKQSPRDLTIAILSLDARLEASTKAAAALHDESGGILTEIVVIGPITADADAGAVAAIRGSSA